MWFNRRRDPRIRDEIQFHRDRLVDDYVAAGMNRPDAERRAFLELGNVTQIEERVKDVRGRWLEDFGKDMRYAVRTLRRNRGFATVAVLSLALGIGANTAIFSLINAVMLRALPVQEPDRLVQIGRWSPEGRPRPFSYLLFRVLSRQRDVFFRHVCALGHRSGDRDRRRRGVRNSGTRVRRVLHRARDQAGGWETARAGRRYAVSTVTRGGHQRSLLGTPLRIAVRLP